MRRGGCANPLWQGDAAGGVVPRAAALVLCCTAAWLNTAVWRPTPGMGWFPVVYFLKLLVSHAAGKVPKE